MRPIVTHIVLGLLTLTVAGTAAAEIVIERTDGKHLRVSAVEERNVDLLAALSREMGFTAIVKDDVWASTRRDFERTGVEETLLHALLKDTSTIIGYRGSTSRIHEVTVLGPSAEPLQIDPPIDTTTGEQAMPAVTTAVNESAPEGPVKAPRIGQTAQPLSTPGVVATADTSKPRQRTVPDMLRGHAQPGQVSADKTAAAGERTSATGGTSMQPSADQQQALRELTAQAQRDVRNLAEALRAAEAAINPKP